MDENKCVKICPDLTQVIWEKAMCVGNGDYQRIQLNECLKEKCAAYYKGRCCKYNNNLVTIDID